MNHLTHINGFKAEFGFLLKDFPKGLWKLNISDCNIVKKLESVFISFLSSVLFPHLVYFVTW